ncbi:6942_t:CDS:2 [Gigaspora rosea]|nr:6942_t:CDS:2 [Gigaspora rosea]
MIKEPPNKFKDIAYKTLVNNEVEEVEVFQAFIQEDSYEETDDEITNWMTEEMLDEWVEWITLYEEQRKLNEALIQQLTFEIEYDVIWNYQNGPEIDSELGEEDWHSGIEIDPEEWPQPIEDFIDWEAYYN